MELTVFNRVLLLLQLCGLPLLIIGRGLAAGLWLERRAKQPDETGRALRQLNDTLNSLARVVFGLLGFAIFIGALPLAAVAGPAAGRRACGWRLCCCRPPSRSAEMSLLNAIVGSGPLHAAWAQVKANHGGPGIDQMTLARWERNLQTNLLRLSEQVRANRYRPNPPRRFKIRKKDGGWRELSVLTVADRVLQRSVLNVLDPLAEARFLNGSHGYRHQRSVATAVEQVLDYRERSLHTVLEGDITACFDSLDHDIVLNAVRALTDDYHVLHLCTLWLAAGRKHANRAVGVPLGAVLSPLWCNLVLHTLDAWLADCGWRYVRYADDFVVFTSNERLARLAATHCADVLAELRLELNPRKTTLSTFREGFTFLGVTFQGSKFWYNWQGKQILHAGRNKRRLYDHLPTYYEDLWPR